MRIDIHNQAATCRQKQCLRIINKQATASTHTIHALNIDKIAHQGASASLASQDYGTRTKELNMLRLHLNQGTAAKDPNMLSQSLSIIYELA